jgi:hypothetical protein
MSRRVYWIAQNGLVPVVRSGEVIREDDGRLYLRDVVPAQTPSAVTDSKLQGGSYMNRRSNLWIDKAAAADSPHAALEYELLHAQDRENNARRHLAEAEAWTARLSKEIASSRRKRAEAWMGEGWGT